MVQARLRELGYEIEPDGIFNQNTSDLIRMFQIANNLPADGRVTQDVWEKLMNDDEADEPVSTQPEGQPKIRIEIDIVKHTLTVFSNNQQIKQFPVGVGKSETPSPLGEWKIVQKSLNWGNGFGTRWMRLSVPWGIYGIHGTDKPYSVGMNLSHGCIRMRNKDVEALYPLIPMGTTVKIMENGQIFPKSFSGPTLKEKSNGQNVVYLQSRLKEKGIIFDSADGRYGKMTELAVKYYQVWHGFKPTGIADTELYRSLGMVK
jgi:peptidoglycan hydrolase-like protein with peptidoglycan-binding domain